MTLIVLLVRMLSRDNRGAGSMAIGVVSCLGKEIGRALKPNLLPPWAHRPPEQGLEEVRGCLIFLSLLLLLLPLLPPSLFSTEY